MERCHHIMYFNCNKLFQHPIIYKTRGKKKKHCIRKYGGKYLYIIFLSGALQLKLLKNECTLTVKDQHCVETLNAVQSL